MTENPFGDNTPEKEKRNYMVLISASKENASLAQKYLKNIQTLVDPKASPLWIDSKGAGVFLSTSLVAWEIRAAIKKGTTNEESIETKDILVLQLGADWSASKEAKTEHWLASHVGTPLFPPYDSPYVRKHRPR